MIHKYEMNGLFIVLDVNSGAVHVVDRVVYDALDAYPDGTRMDPVAKQRYTEEEISEAIEEIRTLEAQGLLFAQDDSENASLRTEGREPVVKALCLHAAHDCNLRCAYCFAGEGEYHGSRSLMTEEIGKQSIDFILEHAGSRRNLEIDFFGGEPTLNFDVVKKMVAYGREQEKKQGKSFRFTLTTNGLLLDEDMLRYVNENMQNVVLSIDGRPEVNDRMRKSVNGKGSYDAIVPRFLRLAQSRGQRDYYVRGTFTRENLDFYEDVIHLADLGFRQISVEPVVAEPNQSYALTEGDADGLCGQYEKLAKEILHREKKGEGFQFFHFMLDLTGGPCVAKRLTGCGAGTEYLAVTPEGDLYPCHQFVGLEDFRMGHVREGVTNKSLRKAFAGCHVYAKEACRACWARFYCSGGCAANAYRLTGDINGTYELGCRLQKKRIECAIMMKAYRALYISIDGDSN